ncbi:MAG: restriction endonuclease [Planctomycetota bacterium]|jgi:restriction endonuclease Mrr
MAQVKCRRCGEVIELPDFHGAKTVVCPGCNWGETYPARRHLSDKLTHDAGAAFKARQRHEVAMGTAVERLQGLSPRAFEKFCAQLFSVLGHGVVPADAALVQSYAFQLHDGAAVTYVACRRTLGDEAVSRDEVENLAGAMRHDGVRLGAFVTTGTFAEACREIAEKAGIELIDREALRRRLESVDSHDLGSLE